MAKFEVVEIFSSINGEGKRAGELAVFVRLKGCNLNCSYCDTTWANKKDATCVIMTEDEIYNKVKKENINNVTITGGEPLFRKNIDVLLKKLSDDESLNIEIETNGSVDIKEFADISCRISFTLDYKLNGSGMEEYMKTDNYSYISSKDTVKFVVSDRNDLNKAKQIIDTFRLDERCNVYLSPVFGRIEPKEIVEFMKEQNMNKVRIQLQLHKFIWDPQQKGV